MNKIELKHLSQELNLKLILLEQRISVFDELMLHTSRTLNESTANYYVQVFNKYGNFFNAIRFALASSFYVELLAFLGIKLDKNKQIIRDRWATASVYNLASECNKKADYLEIVDKHKEAISLIDEVRHHIAHATSQEELNKLLVPGYNRVVELMNDVAGIVMTLHDELCGVPGWNKPHTLQEDNDFENDTEELINAISTSSNSKSMRLKYNKAKKDMRNNQD